MLESFLNLLYIVSSWSIFWNDDLCGDVTIFFKGDTKPFILLTTCGVSDDFFKVFIESLFF